MGRRLCKTAADAQSAETTALEQEAAQFVAGAAQIANNAQIASQNEILGGVTPGQQLDTSSLSTGTSGTTIVTVASYVGIAAAVVGLIYLLTRKKA